MVLILVRCIWLHPVCYLRLTDKGNNDNRRIIPQFLICFKHFRFAKFDQLTYRPVAQSVESSVVFRQAQIHTDGTQY